MNILVTGRGTSGSWAIRGQQLGEAIGATVERIPPSLAGFDLGIVVKRIRPQQLQQLQAVKLPLVWDVVDAWPQPSGNAWEEAQCVDWLRHEVKSIAPRGIVAATKRMAVDCAPLGLPVFALPHHARPVLQVNPIREKVSKIGYEGGEQYLGAWRQVLESECARRGWEFVINPAELADLDIVVAFREARGYAARHWKSNVKLANAQGSGTPCIMNMDDGYTETDRCGGVLWVDDINYLSPALDALEDVEIRRKASQKLLEARPELTDIARRYKDWLWTLI